MSPVTLGGKNCLGWKMKTTTICHGGEIFKTTSFAILSEGFPDCGTLLAAAAPRFAEDADLLADLAHWGRKKSRRQREGFSLVYWQNVGLARVGNWLRTSLLSGGQAGRVVM